MEPLSRSEAAAVFGLLANPQHIELLSLLAISDMRLGEIADKLGLPTNRVRELLFRLGEAGLVAERRSDANPEDRYYQLHVATLRARVVGAVAAIHPALPDDGELPTPTPIVAQGGTVPRVLFLCTHNSARSQMAEALLRSLSGGRVEAHSAGTIPSTIHPMAVETMRGYHLDISTARSKHLDEYNGQVFDYVITVCDKAREACPSFPGAADAAHWSLPDPAAIEDPEERRIAFGRVAVQLTTRIRFLVTVIERNARKAAAPA